MILIIDDDAAVRSSLTFLLKRAGFRPEAVPGPKEALEVVRATAPELILMDMNFTLTTTGEEDSIIETGEDLSSRCTCDLDDRLGIDLFGRAGNASRSLRFLSRSLGITWYY